MVAITVILAAVIGTFVLGLGEQVEQNARAGINADVDNANEEVTISLTTLDNSDYVVVRGTSDFGAISGAIGNSSYSSGNNLYLNTTGQTVTLSDVSSGASGTLTLVAVANANVGSSDAAAQDSNPPDSATTTTVQQVDYDF
jgi:FlaG/FlaF family flagellin (archaellin)